MYMRPEIDQSIEHLTRIYKALAHPVRLQLLHMLAHQEGCVCHLVNWVRRPQPYVSQQLGILREVGLVVDRRDGQTIYYRVVSPVVKSLLSAGLEVLRCQGVTAELPAAVCGPLAGCSCPMCASHTSQDAS
jgi:DNA-binding transcriptional ArsR family regulator